MNFFINKAMGIGNSGVEHAQFYRAKCFERVNIPYKYVFTELVKNLHEAMNVWHIPSNKVISMWEVFVLDDAYLKNGAGQDYLYKEDIIIDFSETHREKRTVTSSGLLLIEHMEKSLSKKKQELLLVSEYKVEIYEFKSMKRKVMYEIKEHPRRGRVIQNIHLFDFNQEHLFFRNEVLLQRFFFHYLASYFGGKTNFILDRGQETEAALFYDKPENSSIIELIHADHLSDREVKESPLWNNHYEYLFTHIDQVDKVIVSTELQRQDLLLDFPMAHEKILTIPVGGVKDQGKRTRCVNNSEKKIHKFITASRLASEKHLDIVIKAVQKIHEEYPDVLLDIYGQGGEDVKLKKLIHELSADAYIQLKGLSHDLEKVYTQYDAFLSGSYSEGFGLTYIEALNAGLPIVTFKARFGAMELVKDGETGFLKNFSRTDDEYSVNQLAIGIKQLLTGDYKKIKEKTQQSVEAFQESVIATKWRDLIHEL